MPDYPLLDSAGKMIGRVFVENDELPNFIMNNYKDGEEVTPIRLAGSWQTMDKKFRSFIVAYLPAEEKKDEYWTVHPSFWGSRDFAKEEDARAYYEGAKEDDWNAAVVLTHTEVLRTYRSEGPKR